MSAPGELQKVNEQNKKPPLRVNCRHLGMKLPRTVDPYQRKVGVQKGSDVLMLVSRNVAA